MDRYTRKDVLEREPSIAIVIYVHCERINPDGPSAPGGELFRCPDVYLVRKFPKIPPTHPLYHVPFCTAPATWAIVRVGPCRSATAPRPPGQPTRQRMKQHARICSIVGSRWVNRASVSAPPHLQLDTSMHATIETIHIPVVQCRDGRRCPRQQFPHEARAPQHRLPRITCIHNGNHTGSDNDRLGCTLGPIHLPPTMTWLLRHSSWDASATR